MNAMSTMTTYEVALPDGGTIARRSARHYTHAVVARGERGWGLVGYCGSLELAERRLADWRRCAPAEPAQIAPVRAFPSLTDRQRSFLVELGDRVAERMSTPTLASLARRGLVERSFIGMRYWRVRRTEAGARAVGATLPAPGPGATT